MIFLAFLKKARNITGVIILACFPSVSIYIRKSHVFFLLLAATEPPSIPQLPSLFLEFFEKVIGMYFFRKFFTWILDTFHSCDISRFFEKARNQWIESMDRIKESNQESNQWIKSKNRIKESNQRTEPRNRINESNQWIEPIHLHYTLTLTLYTYTIHLPYTLHYTLTPYTYTIHLHYTLTLYTYTMHLHYTLHYTLTLTLYTYTKQRHYTLYTYTIHLHLYTIGIRWLSKRV